MLLLHVGGLVVRRITPVAVPRTGRGITLQAVLRPGALLASLALAGCMSVSVPDLPDRTPSAWTQVPQGQGVAVDARQWWKMLSDPALDGLVDQAIAGNLDLQQATLRLQAVRIVAGTSDSRFLPEISASAKQVQDAAAVDTYFHAGIEAIWDLGLFGAAKSAQLGAQASAGNAEALRRAAQVAVIADVVRSYLDLTVAQAQQDLLTRQQAVDDRGEQLARVRQRLHLDEPGELDRLRARQAATRAAIAQAGENADNAARALALLLGRDGPDPAWRAYRTPPKLGAFALQQVPADLLRHRPQILLAESEVLQAAADKGSARAAMYPRVSLGGSILYAYNLTQNARSNSDSSPSIGPYIDIPLWDWGQRRARFHANEKQLDAALLGYRKAVLEGVSEVEGALGSLARQDSSIQSLRAANDAAGQQVKRQARQVQLGLSSEFEGLDTQRAALASQGDLIAAQGARVLAFASLYRALGGAPLPVEAEGELQ
ncbi:TolC family protein [uncultured Stenotrophomonas sp.]|uniref:TolC family protein n=1 Tax=uncultured Stenotrophomonas sp. TaxID=165438 RepID=UPI0025EB5B8F|nr:TolC family protein [uncultured Stenotrophomonas sp.]